MNVVLDGTRILCANAKPMFSDEELVEFLLMQLSYHLLNGS